MAALTVLYDGACALCRSSVARVRRWDRQGKIALLDLNDPEVLRCFPQVDPEQARRLMQAVSATGQVYAGVDAWRQIASVLPGWRWLGWLLGLPGVHALSDRVYRWVARNRYRWNRRLCTDAACQWHGRVP